MDKCVEGWNPSAFDEKLTPETMSLRIALIHLAEVYVAVQKQCRGEEHEWGSYAPSSSAEGHLIQAFHEERRRAVEAILGLDDEEKAAHLALDFIILHDAYHVGQLCSLRLKIEPEWNMYVIYGS